MNFDEQLNYFHLNKNYSEDELDEAYKQKLAELQYYYQTLKQNLNPQNSPEKIKVKINETLKKIMFAEAINEDMAGKLFIPLLKLREDCLNGTLNPNLLIYLDNLKLDGGPEDLDLLDHLSQGTTPNTLNCKSKF